MRAFGIIALLLFSLIGIVGATIPTPTYNFGPDSGFTNPGPIKAAYLTATSDALVSGDLTVSGSLGVTGTTVDAGIINQYITTHGISNTGVIYSTGNDKFRGTVAIDHLIVNGTTATIGGMKNAGTTSVNHLLVNGTSAVTGAEDVGGAFRALTAAVNTSDGLTVNSIIVPTEIAVTVMEGNLSTKAFFTADTAWKVTAIREVHSVVGPTNAVYNIESLTGTTAPGSGTKCMTTTGSLTSTINAVASPALSATPADYTLAAGDRLGIKLSGAGATCGALLGVVTVYLERV
jgi:hypothetical protein